MRFFKAVIYFLIATLFASVAIADEDIPIYAPKGLVGKKNNLIVEIDVRVKGIIASNNYVVRNHKNDPVTNWLDIPADKKGYKVFIVETYQKPGLKIRCRSKVENGKLLLEVEQIVKAKNGLKNTFKSEWSQPNQKSTNALFIDFGKYNLAASKLGPKNLERAVGNVPANYRDMVRLAYLIAIKREQPKKHQKHELVAFYSLLSTVFKRLDTVVIDSTKYGNH